MGVNFILLTCHASVYIVSDEGSKSWPPVVTGKEFLGFETPEMSCGRGVMIKEVSLQQSLPGGT